MAALKCKMCGGTLEAAVSTGVAECEYCGTQQTLTKSTDEVLQNLFNRANSLRLKSEFDKAQEIYEKIVNTNSTDAEAYWGIVLCKYGIEYVEDPATFKRVPTCHRTQIESIFTDVDYTSALENADIVQKGLYEAEAQEIDRLQRDILKIANGESPFDVFICYKETDENGKRTADSVIANDIYHQLTQEGFKVFYAAITLEDKLGQEYEPYIFAALNSAKVMLAVGSRPEYFHAVWVKNEWSRYLKLMKNDRTRLLIPCYRDMDAYDLPEEFSHLQAQDMGKIGFVNDLLRGIKKVLNVTSKQAPGSPGVQQVATTGAPSVTPLLKRAFIFLEDGDWQSADEYCERVLDQDPECAEAYLGKLMAELQCPRRELLKDQEGTFEDQSNYIKAIRFADATLHEQLAGITSYIKERNENKRLCALYSYATNAMEASKTAADYHVAAECFQRIAGYRDANEKAEECLRLGEIAHKNEIYEDAQQNFARNTADSYQVAAELFRTIPGWKDANEKAEECDYRVKKILELRKSREKAMAQVRPIAQKMIAAGSEHTVGLRSDGTVVAVGRNMEDQCNVTNWKNIVAIAAGYSHTVGLQSNGTVVAVGQNSNGTCNTSKWRSIIAIAATNWHTVGLQSDGTVVAVGRNTEGQCNVTNWKNIVAIAASYEHTVGLRSDGTVVATGHNEYKQCEVNHWENIVAIAAGWGYTVGLRSDGTVVAVGRNTWGECNVNNWQNIAVIATGSATTVGLRSDGTVVATGHNNHKECEVNHWENIVAIAAGSATTVGLRSDGTVVVTGANTLGECDVSNWKLFGNIYTLVKEDARQKLIAEKHAKICALQSEKSNLGIFAGKKKKEIDQQIAALQAELSQL